MRKISLNKKDKSINPKLKLVLIILVCVFTAIGIGIFIVYQNYHIFETNIRKPTCEAEGYTESVCVICKKIERSHYTARLGHNYGEVKLKTKPSEIVFGKNYQECSRCKSQKTINIEPTIDFKKLYFTGDAFTVDMDMVASGSITYSYKGVKTTNYVALAYVDSDRSRYIKHNYIISFFADKEHKKPVEIALMTGKPAAHSWRLSGNHYDFNNVRDIIVSELFCDARKKSTKLVDKRLKDNFLTSKQEPILFFMNTSFVGVFNLSEMEGIGTMNVKETDKNCAIVRASYSSNQSYFRTGIEPDSTWKVKYNSSDDDKWIYDSLNNLATFVAEKEGKEFKEGISKYLDVDAMIDYMLVVYNTAAADNIGRSLTLATYDGKVWIPTFFDADASFGLNNKGEITLLETILAPEIKEVDGEMIIKPDTNSLLFDKMFNNFYNEIKLKYNQLKDSVFATKNIQAKFAKHINKVPKYVYDLQAKKYPVVDSKTDMQEFLNEFMAVRKANLEAVFETKKPTESQETTTILTTKETTN